MKKSYEDIKMKKIYLLIITGLIGSLVGEIAYFSKAFAPNIWKEEELAPIYIFILFGFIVGFGLAYLWLRERNNKG